MSPPLKDPDSRRNWPDAKECIHCQNGQPHTEAEHKAAPDANPHGEHADPSTHVPDQILRQVMELDLAKHVEALGQTKTQSLSSHSFQADLELSRIKSARKAFVTWNAPALAAALVQLHPHHTPAEIADLAVSQAEALAVSLERRRLSDWGSPRDQAP